MAKIDFNKSITHQPFEIAVQIRDNLGNPTGNTRGICSNEGFKIWEFYNKNAPWIWDGEEYKLRGGRRKKGGK